MARDGAAAVKGSSSRHGCRVVTTSLTARVLLANQLHRLPDVRWTVVSGDDWDDPPDGLDVVVLPIRRELSPSALVSFFRLWRHFRRVPYDFVQTHTPMASLLGLPAARLAGRHTVYTIHGALYFEGNGRLANVAGWCFERWCCAWAQRVLVQSREDEERLPAVGICRRAKVRYVGNGIVVERFAEPVARALTSARPHRGDGEPPGTGEGLRRLPRTGRRALRLGRVRARGPRRARPARRHHGRRDRGGHDVRCRPFVGAVDDVRPYLASATVVVLPSYREGIPRVAMEAAAMGRPVVAYDIRGMREVIDPEHRVARAPGGSGRPPPCPRVAAQGPRAVRRTR